MDLRKYQRESYIAVPPHSGVKDEIANWAVGLSEEVGEVNNVIKHFLWNGEPIDKAKLVEECGDVLWYLNAMCTVLGIDFNVVAELNVSKLGKCNQSGTYCNHFYKLRYYILQYCDQA